MIIQYKIYYKNPVLFPTAIINTTYKTIPRTIQKNQTKSFSLSPGTVTFIPNKLPTRFYIICYISKIGICYYKLANINKNLPEEQQ